MVNFNIKMEKMGSYLRELMETQNRILKNLMPEQIWMISPNLLN